MKVLPKTLHQKWDIRFLIMGKDMVACAFDIMMIFKMKLKIAKIKGWRHALLLNFSVQIYRQLLNCPK